MPRALWGLGCNSRQGNRIPLFWGRKNSVSSQGTGWGLGGCSGQDNTIREHNMNSFKKLKGMAGASVIAGAGLVGMMASSARAAVKTSWTTSTGGYFTFHDNGKDWAHGFYFSGTSSTSITDIYSSISEGALGRTASCTATVTTFWNCYEYSDAYDGVLSFSVNSNGFAPVNSEVVVSDYGIDAGKNVAIDTNLDAHVKWYFPPKSPVARGLISVTNTGETDATDVDITVSGNFGSDSSTVINATSSGDTTLDATDLWFISSDDEIDGNNSDPVIITVMQGPGSKATSIDPLLPTGDDDYDVTFTLDIPAGETRSIVMFHKMYKDLSAAESDAATFAGISSIQSAGLLGNMTASEKSSVVNFAQPKSTSPATTARRSSSGGSAGITLLGLLGMLGLTRRRRK